MGRKNKILQRLYAFIDYDDIIIKHCRNQYRAYCPQCGADRGYKRPSKFNRICIKCNGQQSVKIMQNAESIAKRSKTMKGRIPWNKRRSPLHVKLRHSISSLVNKRLRKRGASKYGQSFFAAIGYPFEILVKHLESKFLPGMTWNNYGEWHVDHIRADSWFNYDNMNCDTFKECWSLDNLQPLWAKDNLKKSDKQ
jgi:hypothetical protein